MPALTLVAGIAIAWFGFSNVASDIQIIIGLIGAFAALLSLGQIEIGVRLDGLRNRIKDIQAAPRQTSHRGRKPQDTMPDAIDAYIAEKAPEMTEQEAIKQLTIARLKDEGFLRR